MEPYLHALVLEYTDARHIQHKAAALYALSNGEAATVVHGDETMNSVAYRNDVLGYTLEMPLSFRNTVGIRQYEDGSVHFNMLDEADSSSAHDICIMTLEVSRPPHSSRVTAKTGRKTMRCRSSSLPSRTA